jgi:hypothetical protein
MTYLDLAEALVREHGTDSQRQRLAADLDIPEAELKDAVRAHLFGPMDALGLPRWKRVTAESVRRIAVKRGLVAQGVWAEVAFEVLPTTEVTGTAWERLTALRAALPEAETKLFVVTATIGTTVVQKLPKVRVIMPFGDRTFHTEIYLGGEAQWV